MSKKIYQICIYFALTVSILGCASFPDSADQSQQLAVEIHSFEGDKSNQKSIFVFLDGTMNTEKSATNVWRLYDSARNNKDPQLTAIYLTGVGSVNDKPLTGSALGRGMEDRILAGYKFVTDNYERGDEIYLFGFSRGAHQARALAGLIAYAGVPVVSDSDSEMIGNEIIELLKKKSDEDYVEKWALWQPDQAPLLASELKKVLNIDTQAAEVKFLGVWDTVPGSSLKDYGDCKEKKGVIKEEFHLLIPGVDKGERYKSDSYPAIRNIAHAVSIDEKRSKFAPLLICAPINPEYTKVKEVWFPGAHADVGGGYEDSNDLPNISLAWMINLLNKSYAFNLTVPEDEGNASGLAHWSIGDSPGNIGSDCENRKIKKDAVYHSSYKERVEASPVPILRMGKEEILAYPLECSEGQQ